MLVKYMNSAALKMQFFQQTTKFRQHEKRLMTSQYLNKLQCPVVIKKSVKEFYHCKISNGNSDNVCEIWTMWCEFKWSYSKCELIFWSCHSSIISSIKTSTSLWWYLQASIQESKTSVSLYTCTIGTNNPILQ